MSLNMELNPMEIWQRALAKWETSMNELANRGMRSDGYNQAMQKMSTLNTELQRKFDSANGLFLASLNLPSRQQIEEINGRLAKIEEALARLTEAGGTGPVASVAAEPSARPARTRKSPSAAAAAEPAAAKPSVTVAASSRTRRPAPKGRKKA